MPLLSDGRYQPLWREGDTVRVLTQDPEIRYLPVLPVSTNDSRPVTRVPIGKFMVYRGVKWLAGTDTPFLLFDYENHRIMVGAPTAEAMLKKQYTSVR